MTTDAVSPLRSERGARRQLSPEQGQASTWDSIGYAYHHLGDHTHAITSYQHALTLFRDLGDRYQEADTLTRLGDTHHTAGQPDDARDAWQQAITILDDLNHPDVDQVRAKLAAIETPNPDNEDTHQDNQRDAGT